MEEVKSSPGTHAAAGAETSNWYDNKLVIIGLLYIFYPLGLIAVWSGRRFRLTEKIACSIIFIPLSFCCSPIPMASMLLFRNYNIKLRHDIQDKRRIENEKINQSAADADGMWNRGQKAEAVELYLSLIASGYHFESSEGGYETYKNKLAIWYQRVIEYRISSGATEAARDMIHKALESSLAIALTSPEGNKMMEEERMKINTAREKRSLERREKESNQEEHDSGTKLDDSQIKRLTPEELTLKYGAPDRCYSSTDAGGVTNSWDAWDLGDQRVLLIMSVVKNGSLVNNPPHFIMTKKHLADTLQNKQ